MAEKKTIQYDFAGLFYPSTKELIEQHLAGKKAEIGKQGPDLSKFRMRAAIVPSGNYTYSSEVAVMAYEELQQRDYQKVFILGTADFVNFPGVAITQMDAMDSPLGPLNIDKKIVEELEMDINFSVNELAIDKQHSLEVQLPYIRYFLGEPEIVPLILGHNINVDEVAGKIEEVLTEKSLIIVSTNLSHYLKADKAAEVDLNTITQIQTGDTIAIQQGGEASSLNGLMVLNEIANIRGWETMFMKYQNSGQVSEDQNSVIGYVSFLYHDA